MECCRGAKHLGECTPAAHGSNSMIVTAQLLDAPANPARTLAAVLRQSLALTSTPTLLPSATRGAWTVLFGSEKDAAAAFAHCELRCFGRSVRIVRLDGQHSRARSGIADSADEDSGYVARFSDFVDEMEAEEDGTAHASEESGDAKRNRDSSNDGPLPKRRRSEPLHQAVPVWHSGTSAKSTPVIARAVV